MASSSSPVGGAVTDDNAASQGPALLAVSVSTTLVALLTCGLRLFVRWRISKTVGWDDYTIGLAMVMGMTGMIFSIIESQSLDDRIRMMQFDFLSQPWLMFGSTLAKISVCFFFLRTIGRARPWNRLLGVLIVLLAVVNLAFALTSNLQCRPLEKLWNPAVDGSCFDPVIETNLGYFQGGFAVFTYFFLSIFPVMIVRDAGVSKSIRWPFYVLSACSFVAALFSIVRVYETSLIDSKAGFTTANLITTVLAIIVQNLGIVAANILTFGPLFSKKARQLSLSHGTSDNELIDRHANSSRRSSITSTKRDTTLVIQGARTVSHYQRQQQQPDGTSESRSTVTEVEDRQLVSMKVGGMYGVGETYSSESLSKGILRTISVEVVAEDRSVVEARYGGRKASNGDDWRTILRGPAA